MNAFFWAVVLLVIAAELIQRSMVKNRKQIVVMVSALLCLYIGGYTLHHSTLDGSKPKKPFHYQLKKNFYYAFESVGSVSSSVYDSISKNIKAVIS